MSDDETTRDGVEGALTAATDVAVGLTVGALDALSWLLRDERGDRAPAADGTVVPLDPAGATGPAGREGRRAAGSRAGEVAAGVLFGARDAAVSAAGVAGQAVEAATTIGRGVARLPGVEVVARRVEAATDDVAARGRQELARSEATRDRVVGGAVERITAEAVPAATDRLAAGPLADVLRGVLPVALDELGRDPDALTGLVGQVLPGILDAALPEVLDRLASDTDLLLPLVTAIVDRVLPDVLARLGDDPDELLQVVDPVLPAVLDRLGRDPEPLLDLIDALLPPLLDRVLPAALDQLNEDPTVVRNLVIDQSGGMATEMANSARSRAVAADDLLDRIGRRVLRRPVPPRPEVPAPAARPALGPGAPAEGDATSTAPVAPTEPVPTADGTGSTP